uniref:Tc1-like transposase DDE domain-containing protein n=1 Tax=Caenorhabditis japonica TaxID=281687 RepID=A0A8R1IAD6_CAEJA
MLSFTPAIPQKLDSRLKVLDWPTCSPDLNPIENLLGILVHFLSEHPTEVHRRRSFTFQQDNAAIHSRNSKKNWFVAKGARLAGFVCRVYQHGKQYKHIQDLKLQCNG